MLSQKPLLSPRKSPCSKMQNSFLVRRGFLLCFAQLWKRGKSALEHTFSLLFSLFPCLSDSVSHRPLLFIKIESLGNSESREEENDNYL